MKGKKTLLECALCFLTHTIHKAHFIFLSWCHRLVDYRRTAERKKTRSIDKRNFCSLSKNAAMHYKENHKFYAMLFWWMKIRTAYWKWNVKAFFPLITWIAIKKEFGTFFFCFQRSLMPFEMFFQFWFSFAFL